MLLDELIKIDNENNFYENENKIYGHSRTFDRNLPKAPDIAIFNFVGKKLSIRIQNRISFPSKQVELLYGKAKKGASFATSLMDKFHSISIIN